MATDFTNSTSFVLSSGSLPCNLVICHVVSREESPLSPEQQVLLDAGAQPRQTLPGEHHGGSRMELSPATDDLRSLPLTGRFCYWLSGHFSARQSCKKQTAMHFYRLPNCNFHSMHVRKLSVDTVDAKFQPSKTYTV